MDVQHNRDMQRDSGCAMEDGGAMAIQGAMEDGWTCNGTLGVQHNWGVQWRLDVQHNQDVQWDFGCAMEDGRATGHCVCNTTGGCAIGLWVCNGGWMCNTTRTCNGTLGVQWRLDVQHNWGVQWRLDVQQDSGCAMESGCRTGLWVCN